MATAAVIAPHDVQATLNYLGKETLDGQIPFNILYKVPPEVPRTNITIDPHEVVIHDARGQEDAVSLDKTGFQFVKHVSQEKDFLDDKAIEANYYKEVEELLKRETGAKRVFIFDHTVRRNYEATPGADPDVRGPVQRVHIDQTFAASVNRVRYHLPDEADRLLKSRVRIINVWRPIGHPVAHNPLAVADYFSLNVDHDLVSMRHIYPDREGAIFAVKYNPGHRWYYLSDQTPEEVTLIKCFDSSEDRARLTPHSAFVDATSPATAPQRQSIEVRALVFDAE
ncbi:hypothetical protein BDN71DRAFT_901109 [Pleurotus eryngii]|uniref:Methyltransferase n=1 Tax=Pleurotus eryngii TaxID=5323 RepID=A0A9P6DGH7_PLEER|nr:hypothetical protein BDN71DRAFT_901109 [Pleurotus eryngii]